jgi:hypothetical protein
MKPKFLPNRFTPATEIGNLKYLDIGYFTQMEEFIDKDKSPGKQRSIQVVAP